MRSAIIAAAFAVGALAVPFQHLEERDYVTETQFDIEYVTDIVTVTAGQPAPSPIPVNKHGNGNHGHHHFGGTTPAAAPSPAPSPNNPQPQPQPAPSPTTPQTDLLPTSTAAAAPSGGGSGSGSGSDGGDGSLPSSAGSSYADIATYHHNIHRLNHSAPEIAWDASLQKSAADIAATCIYAHNVDIDGGGYGQNIAAGVEPNNISAIITNLFYNGEVSNYDGLYGEANPSMALFEEWGHFTQIVWKGTTHFGCATQDCSGQGLANVGGDVSPYFTVCNYKSPGNFGGEYGSNVGEPLGHPTANWNTGLS